jgi:pimeloyl-ACP methyl ester carboxylesterase
VGAPRLAVHRWGDGPPLVLVHGGVLAGRHAWRAQRPLAERFTLLAPGRIGHGDSPPGRQDFAADAPLIADQLLTEPAHLVGHSYGAIVAALAALIRPEHVRSLTLVEPPATAVCRGDAEVDALAHRLRAVTATADGDPAELLRSFFAAVNVPLAVPDELPAPLEQGARALMGGRPPDEAELPLQALRDAPFRTLMVTGGHLPALERIGDRIADATGAERAVVTGAAHLVQDAGAPFNERLVAFIVAARSSTPSRRGGSGSGGA